MSNDNKAYFALCYLDDFIGVENMEKGAQDAHKAFPSICTQLGLALAANKCFPPVTSLIWLAFLVDALTLAVTLPEHELSEIIREWNDWKEKPATTKKQLQSLAEKLQHIAKCVIPARRFTNRILVAICNRPFVCSHPF